jgi:uncharacterized protein (TIGR00156 family)
VRQLTPRFNVLLAGLVQTFLVVMPAYAQYTGPTTTPAPAVNVPMASSTVASVKDALTAPDDTYVVLEGFILNRLRHEHYTFSDATGKIEIELDDKYLPAGQAIDNKTRVRIAGEVDRHLYRPNDIDVKHIEIVQRGVVQ